MPLAISNIAWKPDEESAILDLLKQYPVSGIEIAPTVLYPEWKGFSADAGKRDRDNYRENGLTVCALQAILYARGDLHVFDKTTHKAFLEHIQAVAQYAQASGAKTLVFGSPKNRRRGQLSIKEAYSIGVPFVREVGKICADNGCVLGWEHNPTEYQCDFVLNLADAIEFVEAVDHPGVRVHGDTGGLQFCADPIPLHLFQRANFAHYHASAPFLESLHAQSFDYQSVLAALKAADYTGWISIEMKRPEKGLPEVEQSISRMCSELDQAGLEL